METETVTPIDGTADAEGRAQKRDPRANLIPWRKGQSGNPNGGRVRKKNADAMRTARDYADGAILGLWKLANDPKMPGETRRKAFNDLLDRGFGKVTKVIALKPGDAPEQDPAHDALENEMRSFLTDAHGAGAQTVLPPLSDPFEGPGERQPDNGTRHFNNGARQNNDPIRQLNPENSPELGARYNKDKEKQNIRDAFSLGAIVGAELNEDDD